MSSITECCRCCCCCCSRHIADVLSRTFKLQRVSYPHHGVFVLTYSRPPPPPSFPLGFPPKVGTPRWGLQVYDGALETESMSTFLEAAATAEQSDNTPLTRLPTVMTRKEPKVKPPPPPPPPPIPGAETAEEATGETGGGDESGKYEGMNREEILEKFRAQQAERESARRKAMDEEVRVGVRLSFWTGRVELGRHNIAYSSSSTRNRLFFALSDLGPCGTL